MKQYDVVIAGYTCIDLITNFNKNASVKSISDVFIPGKLIEIEGVDFVLGGAVPNTGLAMKKFGKSVFLNGLIGDDFIGEIAEKQLKEWDVFEGMAKTIKSNTAFSILISPPGFDRIFLEFPGCNQIFSISDINFQAIEKAKVFHFGYPPLLRKFFSDQGQQLVQLYERVQRLGTLTSLDFSLPDPESESGKLDWTEIMKGVFPFVDISTPSIEEILRMMMPEKYFAIQSTLSHNQEILDAIPVELITEIGEQIINMGVKVLLIKAGKQGVYLFTGDVTSLNEKLGHPTFDREWSNKRIWCKAFHADVNKVVNASGAGDTAIAAFLSAILDGEKPDVALKYAAVAGRDNLYCKNIYEDLPDWQKLSEEINSELNEVISL